MKKLSLLIVLFLTVNSFYAQNSAKEELEIFQSLFGMQKKQWVAQNLSLNSSEEADFWALYDEYESKRKEYGQQSFELLMKYVNQYGEINAINADEFMKKAISLRKKNEKLIDSYYKKIRKKTDPVVAMQFYQLESYISGVLRLKIMEEIYVKK